MSIITNIPQNMIDEHVAWHSRPGNPSAGGRRIDPFPPVGRQPASGSGKEFLDWHQGYIQRFNQWVDSLPVSARPDDSIAAWNAIPQMLKMSMLGWDSRFANEERLLANMANFESLDELGQFVEWSLHGFLHNASANMWNEPMLLSFESPRSTFFWQLHGLVDHWRQSWMDHQQTEPVFTKLPINGSPLSTSIGAPGEVDRYQFILDSSQHLTVETTGPSDTVIYIAGPDNPQRLHSSNDDGGESFNARISRQFSAGVYQVSVVFYDRGSTGDYSISISS